MLGPRRPPGEIDLFDEHSELATERELTAMSLADLDARVRELEELAEFFPRLYELRDRAAVENQHRPLF